MSRPLPPRQRSFPRPPRRRSEPFPPRRWSAPLEPYRRAAPPTADLILAAPRADAVPTARPDDRVVAASRDDHVPARRPADPVVLTRAGEGRLDTPAIGRRAAEVARAGTVHLGGTLEEIEASEQAAVSGRHHERPFVLLVQPTLFDPTRAPDGQHTAWAYCHVPHGSSRDMTAAIEAQVERFGPGFRDLIAARSAMDAVEIERRNPNHVGDDINGGVQDLRQLFTRPVARPVPYSTPVDGLYICSSATPPGGGVHGMCGYFAARAALAGR